MNKFVSNSSRFVNNPKNASNKFLDSFSNKKPSPVGNKFLLDSNNFPELGFNSTINTNLKHDTESKKYTDAIQTQQPEEVCDENKVPDGCIHYTLEKNNKITKKYGAYKPSYIDKPRIYTMNNAVNNMVSRWEEYAEIYIDLYGEDIYEKMYVMNKLHDNHINDLDNGEDYNSDYSDSEEHVTDNHNEYCVK